MSYQCQYCNKQFRKESTLISHVCERKRRYQQKDDAYVQWGLQAYVIFYETLQNSKNRNYDDFVASPYYSAFVKFGQYSYSVHCPNLDHFTRYLLKHNRKLDDWCSDQFYNKWLKEYLRRENSKDALQRSIQNILFYTSHTEQYREQYQNYFRLVNENRICHHISTGRVSAWVVYNCDSGHEFLSRLTNEQANSIIDYIDPDFWQAKFADLPDQVEHAQTTLKIAGL